MIIGIRYLYQLAVTFDNLYSSEILLPVYHINLKLNLIENKINPHAIKKKIWLTLFEAHCN